jgi:hypothetical protein
VFVAWEDCRFEAKCAANDIVFTSSRDGVNWSDVARIPIDAVGSGVDHFIPGLAVDPTTSGAKTHLALTYYFYPQAACGEACRLTAGYVSSPDAGAHWSAPTVLTPSMSLDDIAQTSQGPMVGDYISTSFVAGGRATTVVAVGRPMVAGRYDEAMYAPPPLAVDLGASRPSTTAGAAAVTGEGTGETHHALRDD